MQTYSIFLLALNAFFRVSFRKIFALFTRSVNVGALVVSLYSRFRDSIAINVKFHEIKNKNSKTKKTSLTEKIKRSFYPLLKLRAGQFHVKFKIFRNGFFHTRKLYAELV
jgi:hypothetical protein